MQATIIGNLTDEPELRFTPNGVAVVNVNIAENHRKKQGNEWVDDGVTFYRATIWNEAAENAAESLHRGMRVIVTGRVRNRPYETREGEKRTSLEIDVDEIGPSIRYATAQVTRRQQSGGGNQQEGWNRQSRPAQQNGQQGAWNPAPAAGNDPWAQQPMTDEPPF